MINNLIKSSGKSALILGILFFLLGFFTLHHYNITWDSINHLPRGQAYLHYYFTGRTDFKDLVPFKYYFQDPKYLSIKSDSLDTEIPHRSLYESDGTPYSWFMTHDGSGHPPASDILSALFNQIFFNRLRLVNDIDSYHIYGIFLAAILVGLIYFWSSKIYGRVAGIISVLSLVTYPLFWSESHFNTEKDIPETVFWSLIIFFIWYGVINQKWRYILTSGIFFGLALGTKFNVLFLPFIILPWITVYLAFKYIKEKWTIEVFIKKYKGLFISGFFAILLGVGLFILLWPFLWSDPIPKITGVLKFYKTIGTTESFRTEYLTIFKFNTYPLQWILYTTPVVTLFLFVFGLYEAFKRIKKEDTRITLLILLWLTLPILRVSWPGSNIYGGIRQIMEYIPALALIAGLGGQFIFSKLSKVANFKINEKLRLVLIVFLFVPIIIKLIQIHPNENVYFNPLIGGLKGAKDIDLFAWGNSFGTSYRQAFIWLNDHAEKNAKLVFTYEHAPNIPSIFIRPDLELQNKNRSGYLMKGEYAVTLVRDTSADRSYFDSFLERFVNPVYQATVDGVAVVKVWKNSPEYLKQPLEEKVDDKAKLEINENDLTITTSSAKKIWRLEIEYDQPNGCQEVKAASILISADGTNFGRQNINLPQDWAVSLNGPQPAEGKFIHPFIGDKLMVIKIPFEPKNVCFKNVRSYKLIYLP